MAMLSWLTYGQRVVLGSLVLLLVDVIWVGSSELTRFLFTKDDYQKPFFTTYSKTALFSMFLFGFMCYRPWRAQCNGDQIVLSDADCRGRSRYRSSSEPAEEYLTEPIFIPTNYNRRESDTESVSSQGSTGQSPSLVGDAAGGTYSQLRAHSSNQPSSALRGKNRGSHSSHHLYPSSYPPSRQSFYQHGHPPLSSTAAASTSADSRSVSSSASKGVRFSKIAEVRALPDHLADEASLARLSFSAFQKAQDQQTKSRLKLTVRQVIKIAFFFCILWFCANYSYQMALTDSSPALVNVLSSSSSLFTLLLAAFFPGSSLDKFTLSKLFFVILSMSGIIVISTEDINFENGVPLGAIWSIASAIFYACYLVFLRRKVEHESKMDLPMFFGFVGIFDLLLLWPCFIFLHETAFETFSLPNREQLVLLVINGAIGTVLSEILWLWGCFLTSSLLATMSLSLILPMSMLADFFLNEGPKDGYSWRFYLGSLPIFLSFVGVSLLVHWDNWDPLLIGCHKIFRTLFRLRLLPCAVGGGGRCTRLCRTPPSPQRPLREDEENLLINNSD